jgi:hypothetical protein
VGAFAAGTAANTAAFDPAAHRFIPFGRCSSLAITQQSPFRPLDKKGRKMLLFDSYPFLNIMWTMFIFFAWVIWIWLLIMILADNFRRTDISGWAKAGWTLFVIFLPLLGVLVYMISRPREDALAV